MNKGRCLNEASNPAHEIWFRYSDIIYKHCLLRFKDKEKARDFYQELFLKFHRHAEKVAEHPAPYLWFLKVITNYQKETYRNKERRTQSVKRVNSSSWFTKQSSELWEGSDLDLSSIPCSALEKMILEFLYVGFSLKEISLLLGISTLSIRRKIDNLKEKLYLK